MQYGNLIPTLKQENNEQLVYVFLISVIPHAIRSLTASNKHQAVPAIERI